MKVELEDRDERGRPLEGGYCFPQAILDAINTQRNVVHEIVAEMVAVKPIRPPLNELQEKHRREIALI